MKEKICPVCSNHSLWALTKLGVDYHQCTSCLVLFSDPIDQDGMVGGEHEEGRNKEQNGVRIERIKELTLGSAKEDVNILDFGCGHGMFLNDLRKAGYVNAVGYDAYNPEFIKMPPKNHFHLVTMTEVIEHISNPFTEIAFVNKRLVLGGVVVIETSFVNIADQEGISLKDFFYIAPQNGHSTIHSHHSLDLLMTMNGFIPAQHINRHVRLYKKIKP